MLGPLVGMGPPPCSLPVANVNSLTRLSRQVQLLESGRMVVLDIHALWVFGTEDELEMRIPVQRGRSFRLTGDGGLMVLGRTASTHFTRVRAD